MAPRALQASNCIFVSPLTPRRPTAFTSAPPSNYVLPRAAALRLVYTRGAAQIHLFKVRLGELGIPDLSKPEIGAWQDFASDIHICYR